MKNQQVKFLAIVKKLMNNWLEHVIATFLIAGKKEYN